MTLHLPPPQLLEIEGPDAAAFAHAQFTSDVQGLPPRRWHWSAWLSAQGRVRAMFRLLRLDPDRLCLYLAGGSAEVLRSTLAPFVLRAKVILRPIERQAIGGYSAEDAAALVGAAPHGDVLVEHAGSVAFAIPGVAPRWCAIGNLGGMPPQDRDALDRWRAADIADGLAELGAGQSERFLPDGLGLGALGAISVRKGCYPGQEIVARLHFKGGNKRWLHRLEYESVAPPEAGMLLTASSGAADGELLNGAAVSPGHGVALAVLPELPAGTILGCTALPGSKFRVVSAIGVASA